MEILIVNEKYNGKKLNNFLLENFNGLNINTIYKALRKKDIRVNNIKISKNVTLHLNDEVIIYITNNELYKNLNIETIFEDSNILIINKPSNIEVVGNNSLTSYLKNLNKYDFIEPCHRLDRNTQGLILFAKNQESLDILFNAFKNQEIIKHYRCLIYGTLPKQKDTLIAYLFKDTKKSLVYIYDSPKKGCHKIVTSYNVIKKNDNNTSVLDIELHTGKTHQIRAHLAFLGFPIIGDGKYGKNEINKKFNQTKQNLYSYSLSFNFKDNNKLQYLNNKTFSLKSEPFAKEEIYV